MALAVKHCPYCASERIVDAGAVFIEDGPWNGKEYANEGNYARYTCWDCAGYFGPMPERVLCTQCNAPVEGELGEDCDQDPEHKGHYLCEDCMKNGGPDE